MDFYWKSKIWADADNCPHTCKTAKPIDLKEVKNARVIKVLDAKYRDATFSGIFLLGDNVRLPTGKGGYARVEVLCKWFKRRLKTRGLGITVNLKNSEVIDKYNGQVLTDFAKG